MDFRTRSKRVPRGLFPTGEVRLFLGEPANRRERLELERRRAVLKKLARRGQWEILAAIRDRKLTVDEVVRIVDHSGLDTLHIEIADPGAGEPLAEVVAEFLAHGVDGARTRVAYEISLRKLVEHVGPSTPWDRVGREDVEELQRGMKAAGYAANTRNRARIAWSSFFTWAMRREHDAAEREGRPPRGGKHPVRRSQPVRVATTRHRFLRRDELERLLEVSVPPMRAQYLTLAFTGMRIGEFVTRRPEEVGDDVIRIHARSDWAPKGHPRYEHGVRKIPVEQSRLLPALREYRERWAGEETFFVNPRTLEPWHPDSLRRQLQRDVEAAGMVYGRAHENGVVIHTFRHSLASWLAQADVQLMKIAEILGDTLPTVQRYYAHLLPADLDRTINAVLGREASDK